MSSSLLPQSAVRPRGDLSPLWRLLSPQRSQLIRPISIMCAQTTESSQKSVAIASSSVSFPILVNGCTGKMGKAVAEAAVSAGLQLVPVSFSSQSRPGRTVQVVAFLAAMEIMAEQFPGAFSGYSLQVMESHQANKVDTSGTAKAVISCFQKLGVSFDLDQVQSKADQRIYNMIDVLREDDLEPFLTVNQSIPSNSDLNY
ncbi:hypothetical protein J5N97_021951 [Dioscorea zingiberensis]|uniref:Dihydrodipicolinate reductase n=1 Tax=Dioscorea zingiberensis TaxID=325984 RepID=A0A9D5C9V2_9LILI|nr:hypothetical protein J5N97_021951 [Dioscorea zingiberensis]